MVLKHRRILAFFALSLVAAVGLTWFCLREKSPSKSPSPVNSHEPAIELMLTTVYTSCRHNTTERKNVRVFNWSAYLGWRLNRQQGKRIYLEKDNESLCAVCTRQEFMGVFEGKVAIFHGQPDRRGPVKEVLPINLSDLPEAENKDLERGIMIKDEREKLQLLEGLSSLQDG